MTDLNNSNLAGLLEISVITESLTALGFILDQFAQTPLAQTKITVFDNCCDSGTAEACSRYRQSLPLLDVVRPVKRLSGEAACFHAVENMNATYGWVLCDDARYDFSGVADVIAALETDDFAAVFLGAAAELGWQGGTACDLPQLISRGVSPYRSMIPWPALAFRTALFNEECLVKGYRLVNNAYGNFAFVNSLVDSGSRIYISKQPLVTPDEGGRQDFTNLYLYAGWLNCCQSINNNTLREKTLYDARRGGSFFSAVTASVAASNDFGSKKFWSAVIDIFCAAPAKERTHLVLLFAVLIAPLPLLWRRGIAAKVAGVGASQGSRS